MTYFQSDFVQDPSGNFTHGTEGHSSIGAAEEKTKLEPNDSTTE
jgi:hypothetical protein